MMTIDKLKNLVNELCPRVNARAWGPTDTVTHTRGKNRSVQIFLPLCTQSLGLALVSVFSPSSFVLRLNNSIHFWKKFNVKITHLFPFLQTSNHKQVRESCTSRDYGNQSTENTEGSNKQDINYQIKCLSLIMF